MRNIVEITLIHPYLKKVNKYINHYKRFKYENKGHNLIYIQIQGLNRIIHRNNCLT